jgi:hypothetical protein
MEGEKLGIVSSLLLVGFIRFFFLPEAKNNLKCAG